MYSSYPTIVFGFHGCDKTTAEAIFRGKSELTHSKNDYDWLGHGIYFWENNPKRAYDYACFLKSHPERTPKEIRIPDVVGAVIALGHCMNLLDSRYIELIKTGYKQFMRIKSGSKIPQNTPSGMHNLDCAVINSIHTMLQENGFQPFDSVRAAFIEGERIYPNSGFNSQNHIQICVINPNCIKGYFRVKKEDPEYHIP